MTSTKNIEGKMNPQKFSLWLILIASSMLFMAFTSAFIVRQGDGNFFKYTLPTSFLYATLVILTSSISMIFAYRSAKKDEIENIKKGLWLTIVGGILFIVLQYQSWTNMIAQGLHLVNPDDGSKVSGSFVYVISFVHLAHVLIGLIFLIVILVRTYNGKVHKKNLLTISQGNTFWHFIGILWVYLYLFLYFAPDL